MMGIKVGGGLKFLFISVVVSMSCISVLNEVFSSRTETGPKVEVQGIGSPALDNTSVSKKVTEVTPKVEAGARASRFEPIDGAFGKRLGSYFDPSSATKIGDLLIGGEKVYHFTPVDPYPGLEEYYVLLTPITHRIYGIWAQEESSGSSACEHEQDILMTVLRAKYGPSNNPDENCWFCFRTISIKQETRSVESTCNSSLVLRYEDHALEEQAKIEYGQLDKKRKKSALEQKNKQIQREIKERNTKGF